MVEIKKAVLTFFTILCLLSTVFLVHAWIRTIRAIIKTS